MQQFLEWNIFSKSEYHKLLVRSLEMLWNLNLKILANLVCVQ